MKTKYIVWGDGTETFHYKFQIEKDSLSTYTLAPTNDIGDLWTEKGLEKDGFKLIDTENGVEISGQKLKLKLDYSQVADLYLLLKLYSKEHKVAWSADENIKILTIKKVEGV